MLFATRVNNLLIVTFVFVYLMIAKEVPEKGVYYSYLSSLLLPPSTSYPTMYRSALSHCSPSNPGASGSNSLRMYLVPGEERISHMLISNIWQSVQSIQMYICVTVGTCELIKFIPRSHSAFLVLASRACYKIQYTIEKAVYLNVGLVCNMSHTFIFELAYSYMQLKMFYTTMLMNHIRSHQRDIFS